MVQTKTRVGEARDSGLGTRQKSGLVRAASGWDAFIFALAGISVGIAFSWGEALGFAFYPGLNLPLALAITVACAVVIHIAYQYWGQIFPRSGGDYVFLSRGFHPGYAIGANFVFVWLVLISSAFAMDVAVPAFAALSDALGQAAGWTFLSDDVATWLGTEWGYMIMGTFFVLGVSALGFFGLENVLKLQKGLFIVALAGTVVVLVALLFYSSGTFESRFDGYMGTTLDKPNGAEFVMSTAKEAGWQDSGFSLSQTLKATPWLASSFFWAFLVLYMGGEIKSARKNISRAMKAAVLGSGVLTLLLILAYNRVVSPDIQGATAYNAFLGTDAAPGIFPHPVFFLRVLFGDEGLALVLTVIAAVAIIAWALLFVPLTITMGQRAVLAWALDGLIPDRFARVHRRYHTPTVASIVVIAMAESILALFIFWDEFKTLVISIPLDLIVASVLLVGAFFPYRRRQLYEQSILGTRRVLGVPPMTWMCLIGAAIWIWQAVMLIGDPVAAGRDLAAILFVGAICVIGTVYFLILKAWKARRGEDVDTVFQEIPVE